MPLNKQAGNMYGFVTHTWNPIRGKCPHECSYCYMKRFKVGELRFVEKEMKQDLGKGNYIFVGSSTDMFAEAVPRDWITKVLVKCLEHRSNTYLFQSKNPKRFLDGFMYPPHTILGTTIETNRLHKCSSAPPVTERQYWIGNISEVQKMVSIEPIMDFDLDTFVNWIKDIEPDFVSIGADSKGHGLPEPSSEKLTEFIKSLEGITKVIIKNNLGRLMKDGRKSSNGENKLSHK